MSAIDFMPQHVEQLVYRSGVVTVSDIRCRPSGAERAGAEERSRTHGVVFTRGGVFVKHVAGREVVADCNHVVFFNGEEPYRVAHPVAGGDDCTVFTFAPDVLADAVRARDEWVQDEPDHPFKHTHAPVGPAELLGQHVWRAAAARLAHGGGDGALELDERAMELLERVLGGAYAVRGERGRGARRPDTSRAHGETAHATQALLNETFAESMDLAQVARRIHASPFHLARLFRRETGRSIHDYRTGLRLGAALERLSDGADDLTALALDLGYSSHAHFTDAFRRAFGLAPSDFRRRARRATAREMSTKLKA